MPRMAIISPDCQYDKHGTFCKYRPRWWMKTVYCDCICHKKNIKWRGPDRRVLKTQEEDEQWYRLGNYCKVYYDSKKTSHDMVQISSNGSFTILWSST